MRFATILSSSIIVAGGASASLLQRDPRFNFAITPRTIDPDGYPSQCDSVCTSILDTIDGCSTAACLCTKTNAATLGTCANCLVAAIPTAEEESDVQVVLNDFNDLCASSIGTLSLSAGGSAATSFSTAGGSATQSGAISFNPDTTAIATTQAAPAATETTPTAASATGLGTGAAATQAQTPQTQTQAAPGAATTNTSSSNPFGAVNGALRVGAGTWGAIIGVAVSVAGAGLL